MSRFILTVAVLGTFALASANTAQAAPKPPSGSTTVNKNITVNKSITVNKNITTVQSNKMHVGNNFRLRSYRGWSSSCWYPQYRCFLYYCPLDGQWYFWSEAMGRFLPISFLASNRPTTVGFGILPGGPGAVGTLPGNNVGTQGTGSPVLPPGATDVPPAGVTNNGGIN